MSKLLLAGQIRPANLSAKHFKHGFTFSVSDFSADCIKTCAAAVKTLNCLLLKLLLPIVKLTQSVSIVTQQLGAKLSEILVFEFYVAVNFIPYFRNE